MEYQDFINERRAQILERFYAALDAAGRPHDVARLMAVSKTVGIDETVAAIRAGYALFGENRPQELVRKVDGLAELAGPQELPAYEFHMIGNLQTNKVKYVVGRAALVHSISSLKLAEAVSKRALSALGAGEKQPVLLETNVSGEESKSGFDPEELRAAMDALVELPGIELRGLMTMAPRGDQAVARKTFEGLRLLRDELAQRYPQLELTELSCGMSEDFEAALMEGSTIVRLGRVVFNPNFGVE